MNVFEVAEFTEIEEEPCSDKNDVDIELGLERVLCYVHSNMNYVLNELKNDKEAPIFSKVSRSSNCAALYASKKDEHEFHGHEKILQKPFPIKKENEETNSAIKIQDKSNSLRQNCRKRSHFLSVVPKESKINLSEDEYQSVRQIHQNWNLKPVDNNCNTDNSNFKILNVYNNEMFYKNKKEPVNECNQLCRKDDKRLLSKSFPGYLKTDKAQVKVQEVENKYRVKSLSKIINRSSNSGRSQLSRKANKSTLPKSSNLSFEFDTQMCEEQNETYYNKDASDVTKNIKRISSTNRNNVCRESRRRQLRKASNKNLKRCFNRITYNKNGVRELTPQSSTEYIREWVPKNKKQNNDKNFTYEDQPTPYLLRDRNRSSRETNNKWLSKAPSSYLKKYANKSKINSRENANKITRNSATSKNLKMRNCEQQKPGTKNIPTKTSRSSKRSPINGNRNKASGKNNRKLMEITASQQLNLDQYLHDFQRVYKVGSSSSIISAILKAAFENGYYFPRENHFTSLASNDVKGDNGKVERLRRCNHRVRSQLKIMERREVLDNNDHHQESRDWFSKSSRIKELKSCLNAPAEKIKKVIKKVSFART